MPYCHLCGNQLSADDRFCGKCGTATQSENEYAPASKNATNVCPRKGYILTNIKALSRKLRESVDTIQSTLYSYCSEKVETGTSFTLIDVSDYAPQLAVNRRVAERMSLTPVDSWEMHQRLLTDRFAYDKDRGEVTEYLFIIGGHDIIPMPKIRHYLDESDFIYSDILYSYLYGADTQRLLERRELFKYASMLHVGRLPLAEDAKFDHLCAYLRRSIGVSKFGLPIRGAYAQTDPHWKRVSAYVSEELYEGELFLRYQVEETNEGRDYFHRSLLLTPPFGIEETARFFNNEASIYYFNMHGSNEPQNGYFVGEVYPSQKRYVAGISPEFWKQNKYPHIVVTEACYGGRFIGDTYADSMLLSSLGNKAVFYLGSSHIAYGIPDVALEGGAEISNADVMAKVFILALFYGYDAAQALYLARKEVFESEGVNDILNDITMVEFNLFGDPTLSFFSNDQSSSQKKSSLPDIDTPIVPKNKDTSMTVKTVYSQGAGSGILDRVRQAVNKNIIEAQEAFSEHLYKYYGVEPRQLNKVFELKSEGKAYYLYEYSKDERSQLIVKLDSNKKVMNIITTK